MIRLYIIGVSILIIAIIANALVVKIGIKSWYDFIELLNEFGKNAFGKLGVIDYLWLFIGYPFVLSFGYWVGSKLYGFII